MTKRFGSFTTKTTASTESLVKILASQVCSRFFRSVGVNFHRLRIGWVSWFLLVAQSALAWPPTYGLEFNLKSKELERAWSQRMGQHGDSYQGQAPTEEGEHRIARELVEKLEAACRPECEVRKSNGKFGMTEWSFRFPDGFGFQVSVDPATVELQLGPWNLETWKRHQAQLQRWLFDFTSEQGFSYRPRGYQENSAHLNIGVASAFDQDGRAFARYLADYWQYPELGSGLLGNDGYNAPFPGELDEVQQQAARDVLESVNGGKNRSPRELAREIERKVYTQSPRHADGAYHYQAVGLKYVTGTGSLIGDGAGDRPFELRANRQPLSAEQTLLQLELQERRMAWLKTQASEPIRVDLDLLRFSRVSRSPRDQFTAFLIYLDDMQMADELDRFSVLLPKEVSRAKPHLFARGKFQWGDASAVKALEQFLPRVNHSPAMQRMVFSVLELPQAVSSAAAIRVLRTLSEMTVANEAGFSAKLLALLQEERWSRVEGIPELRSTLAARIETLHARSSTAQVAPGFWSACQAFFGRRAVP